MPKGSEMPHHRDPHATTRAARRLCSAWHRERTARPVAYRLGLAAAAALGLSAILVALHLDLIAELLGGLALLPLSVAVFFRLLPPPPWTDEGMNEPGGDQGPGSGGPWSPDGPATQFDWHTFERQFRAYVEDRASRPRQ